METIAAASAVPADASPARPREAKTKSPSALLRWTVWSPAVVIIISAAAAIGGIALFLVPLLGVFYAFFCIVAWIFASEGVPE